MNTKDLKTILNPPIKHHQGISRRNNHPNESTLNCGIASGESFDYLSRDLRLESLFREGGNNYQQVGAINMNKFWSTGTFF